MAPGCKVADAIKLIYMMKNELNKQVFMERVFYLELKSQMTE